MILPCRCGALTSLIMRKRYTLQNATGKVIWSVFVVRYCTYEIKKSFLVDLTAEMYFSFFKLYE